MATTGVEQPFVVIVGPTASGKTALAIEMAKKYNGEIICADSRTVYKDMDIGTAKPGLREQQQVPHWGINLVEPDKRYTVSQFQRYAAEKLVEIRGRGKIPFLVGGTGLYVDGVIFNYAFPKSFDETLRQELRHLSRDELYKYCIENNIELPVDDKNKRRLIRSIEKTGTKGTKREVLEGKTIVVGIATEKDLLRSRIKQRTEQMFEDGVVEEAILLGKKYGWKAEAMTSNVYRSIRLLLEGTSTIEEVKANFMIRDWQLAKRQMTWFRRNSYIEWCTLPDAAKYIETLLESE